MRWPPWSAESERDRNDKKKPVSWTDNLNATDWSHYTDPRTVIPTILLTTTILVSARLYRTYLRRIPEAAHIKPTFFRKRSLFGTVTRVGDADGCRLFVGDSRSRILIRLANIPSAHARWKVNGMGLVTMAEDPFNCFRPKE